MNIDRREFLKVAATGAGASLLSSCAMSGRSGGLQATSRPVPAEFRAAWIATVHNLDWPSSPGLSAGAAQGELLRILDGLRGMNMNAVILQVRPNGDAFYRSSLEPSSAWLTGQMGRDPGWDPLAFATAEAHRRGMELHAWFNPFRAMAGSKFTASEGHLSRRRPDWVRVMGSNVWFDPSEPGVRQHTLQVISDVVQRYDIDGVHFDDYFYPYPKKKGMTRVEDFPDQANFARSGQRDRDAWRRSQVNSFVSAVAPMVHGIKSWVKVGISPFGIWRPGVPAGTTANLDAYADLAADARLWLRQGWVDYMMPQLYWGEEGEQSYPLLLRWWASENTRGRHLWPGLDVTSGRGHSALTIGRQVALARGQKSPGHAFWNAKALLSDRAGIAGLLKRDFYQSYVPVPPSPWLGSR
jgi:uncharacterized lipoprotein YddW (UPF0748 family)